MNERIRNAVRIGIPLVAMITLVLSTALPVLAQNKPKPVPTLRLVQGEVVSVSSDNSTIIIKNGNQGQLTINVDANTKYFLLLREKPSPVPTDNVASAISLSQKSGILLFDQTQLTAAQESQITANCKADPGWLERHGTPAQFSDILVGDRIIAEVKTADNLATKVLIIKAPVIQKVSGTISEVTSSTITITPTSGTAVILNWDGNTKFVLKGLISVQSGQYATAVYNRNTMLAQTVEVQATAPVAATSIKK